MRSTRWARHPFPALCVATLLLSQGCFSARPWRAQDRPWDPVVLERAGEVRVQREDGTVVVLVDVRLVTGANGTFLRGTVVDDGRRRGVVMLPAYDVARVETRRKGLPGRFSVWVGVGCWRRP